MKGKVFVNRPSKGQKGFRSIPIEKRFWDKCTELNGCWVWQASLNECGYGNIKHNGVMRQAHRVAWELEKGPIPQGMYVLHRCDNPPCVNPDHLFIGDQFDNMRDMFRKGRGNPGGHREEN